MLLAGDRRRPASAGRGPAVHSRSVSVADPLDATPKVERPIPGHGEVLIKVKAARGNPVAPAVQSGGWPSWASRCKRRADRDFKRGSSTTGAGSTRCPR